ncbi:hypothetical protein ACIBLB_41800 [Streptosporangium canum]|uniref:hypothetical protein n=1 Tax=Streptosporangium canum TaxID=324952 RepID=UPI003790A72F
MGEQLAEHARLHVPEVVGERLTGCQEQGGFGKLPGDRGAGSWLSLVEQRPRKAVLAGRVLAVAW